MPPSSTDSDEKSPYSPPTSDPTKTAQLSAPAVKLSYMPNLDFMRVIAAYFVLLFHFNWTKDTQLNQIFQLGYLGVNVFFCISGFITPLAMQSSGYNIRKWRQFLVSRFFRLYPAFLAILMLELILYTGFGIFGYSYKWDQFTLLQLVTNFTWTAGFFEQPWILPITWTLAIEAQFTLFILVAYALTQLGDGAKGYIARLVVFLMLAIPPYFLGGADVPLILKNTLFYESSSFAMGLAIYYLYTKKISHPVFLVMLTLAFCSEFYGISQYSAISSLITALIITYVPQWHTRFAKYFGKFAYSYFLIHITVGSMVTFNLGMLLADTWWNHLASVLFASVVVFYVAWFFYYKVEKPCHEYSRRLKNRK